MHLQSNRDNLKRQLIHWNVI